MHVTRLSLIPRAKAIRKTHRARRKITAPSEALIPPKVEAAFLKFAREFAHGFHSLIQSELIHAFGEPLRVFDRARETGVFRVTLSSLRN
jgi:hypothetical protein